MTITAIAERAMILLARDLERRLDVAAPTPSLRMEDGVLTVDRPAAKIFEGVFAAPAVKGM